MSEPGFGSAFPAVGVDAHRAAAPDAIRCAVLTVSDTRAPDSDTSGGLIRETLKLAGHQVVDYQIVPDEPDRIRAVLSTWIARDDLQAILSNGGTGIASYMVGDSWKTLKWDADSASSPVDPGLSSRIDGMLTTGHLFSNEGNKGRLYDLDGGSYASFVMGDLEFAYEVWDREEDEYRMIFVLPYYVDDGEDAGVCFRVFSHPTDKADEL